MCIRDRYHPAVVFLYFAGAAGLCMCTLHPYYVLVSYLCGAILLGISCGMRRVLRQALVSLAVIGVTAAVNGLAGGLGLTVLFYLGGTPVIWESVFYGLCSGGMLAAVLQWFACYQRIMTGDKFLELFGRAFPTAVSYTHLDVYKRQELRVSIMDILMMRSSSACLRISWTCSATWLAR